jgi:hypothetical protein
MITILSFMTAIYWGQLTRCTKIGYNLSQYTCSHKAAYAATSAFSVFLFLAQLAFTVGTVMWRGELMNEHGGYDEISQGSSNPYDSTSSGNYPVPQPSADL